MSTKIYNRAFLSDNGIKFNENLDNDASELSFQMECFLKSKYFMYIYDILCILPKNCCGKYLSAKFHDVNNDDEQIIRRFNRYFTGRIDIQMSPKTEGGDFQILYVSDDKAYVGGPINWLRKGDIGYMIQSCVGKLEIITKSTVSGQIQLVFRGRDIRKPEDTSKRIIYWTDYTKLTVNGQKIFDKITPAWHDKPYIYTMNVKAGEELVIQVEWLPHRSDT